MQGRLAAIRLFGPSSLLRIERRNPCLRYTNPTCAGPGDHAIHSQDPQGEEAEEAAKAATAQAQQQQCLSIEIERTQPSSLKQSSTQFRSSPKLENSTINRPLDQSFQQQRRRHGAIDEVSCVGWDGAPVADGVGKTEQEDDRAYYRDHRPSPISEIEIADTRTPIRRATDSDVAVGGDGLQFQLPEYGIWSGEVRVWRPEQLDTAEEALLRAEAMFGAARETGDPDSPQSKVLRRLRGLGGEGV